MFELKFYTTNQPERTIHYDKLSAAYIHATEVAPKKPYTRIESLHSLYKKGLESEVFFVWSLGLCVSIRKI